MAQGKLRDIFHFTGSKLWLCKSFRVLYLAYILFLVIFYLNVSIIKQRVSIGAQPHHYTEMSKLDNSHMDNASLYKPSWDDVPKFQLYIRMSSSPRYFIEYSQWFIKSYRLFFPPVLTRNSLVIGLNSESKNDHKLGEKLKNSWPYPKICYVSPAYDEDIYHNHGKIRSFWDQYYPEKCITAEFVAYVDSDSMFSSLVTPRSIFDGQKPIVIGRAGMPSGPHWPQGTEFFLGHKEIAGFMSYFPVIVKVAHIVKLRNFISKRFGRSFDEAFKLAYGRFPLDIPSQFCVIGNYLWYYHRDDYSFRFQLAPDDSYDGTLHFHKGMVPFYYVRQQTDGLRKIWTPFPRIAIHARYLTTKEHKFLFGDVTRPDAVKELTSILKENFCYTFGFEHCLDVCKKYSPSKVSFHLFQFEGISWHWDKRCYKEQEKYILEAKSLLKQYQESNQPIFGFHDTQNICIKVDEFVNFKH